MMSRIGKLPVPVPSGVEVKIDDASFSVTGPKGTLQRTRNPRVTLLLRDDGGARAIIVSVANPEDAHDRALWGTTRREAANLIEGVTKGFEKKLEAIGVGYKAAASGGKLTLEVGFSHPVIVNMPPGIAVAVEKNIITVSGIDKTVVGEIASQIRRVREPEPYKGKGIKYIDEVIRRKAGKAAKTGAAAK